MDKCIRGLKSNSRTVGENVIVFVETCKFFGVAL